MSYFVHGMWNTKLYRTWSGMKSRCLNPNHHCYRLYGGRGITVCPEWIESFAAFAEAVGPKPGPEFSLDRIDNNGNYEPGNVRWATASEQAMNRRPQLMCRRGLHPMTLDNITPDGRRCRACLRAARQRQYRQRVARRGPDRDWYGKSRAGDLLSATSSSTAGATIPLASDAGRGSLQEEGVAR